MGEWRHGAMHGIGVKSGPNDGRRCRCTTPTPDSSSPCAVCGQGGYRTVHATEKLSGRRHPHQPTRCLSCGHPIERTDR